MYIVATFKSVKYKKIGEENTLSRMRKSAYALKQKYLSILKQDVNSCCKF